MTATLGRTIIAYICLADLLASALAVGAGEGAVLTTQEGRYRIVRQGARLALALD